MSFPLDGVADGLVAVAAIRPSELVVPPDRAAQLRADAQSLPGWTLSSRQQDDLEMLATGAFAPLDGYLGPVDLAAVCGVCRLADGTFWPVPVTLDVTAELARAAQAAGAVGLRDAEGVLRAVVTEVATFRPDRAAMAVALCGTDDESHPDAARLLAAPPWAVTGRLEVVSLPEHADHRAYRVTPSDVRAAGSWLGCATGRPLHTDDLAAIAAAGAPALLLALAGAGGAGVVGAALGGGLAGTDPFTLVRCLRAALPELPGARLAVAPLAAGRGGRRDALLHAAVLRNYGCRRIVAVPGPADPAVLAGPADRADPADPAFLADPIGPADRTDPVGPADRADLVEPADRSPAEPASVKGLAVEIVPGGSGEAAREVRRRLAWGEPLPPTLTPMAVAAVLTNRYPPLSVQGFLVLCTGLSGAGKSTIAQIVAARLAERGDRPVTVLDGDVVRRHLSSELGYTREHRELNVRRVGFVAAEITRNGGAVVCAMIAPYERPRREVREMVRAVGGFLLVHVATSVEVCEERDRKGLYAKARAGLLPEFTGVSDPYESPSDADLVIDTAVESAEDAAERVLAHLAAAGYVLPSDGDTFEVAFDPGLPALRSTASARGKA